MRAFLRSLAIPWATLRLLLCTAAAFVQVGCEPPPRPPAKSTLEENVPLRSDPIRPAQPTAMDNVLLSDFMLNYNIDVPRDIWDAYFVGGEHIGYSHLQIAETGHGDELKYTITEKLRYRQGDQTVDSELIQSSLETNSGKLKSFQATFKQGKSQATAGGIVRGSELQITTDIDQQRRTRKIRWSPNHGGLFALEQKLAEKPPQKVGEKFSFTVLAPLVYDLGRIEVEAMGSSLVNFSDGSSEMLFELEVRSTIEGNDTTTSYVWVDKRGYVRKRFVPSANLVIERTDEKTATALPPLQVAEAASTEAASTEVSPTSEEAQQAYQWAAISLDKPLARPLETSAAGFLITSQEDGLDLATILAGIPDQLVQRRPDGSLQLAVNRNLKNPVVRDVPIAPDLASTEWIQSKAAEVVDLAATVPDGNSRETITSLAKLTRNQISALDDSPQFLSAVDAIAQGKGDSTEHAVLLAALCRSKGIPARVVAGLTYVDTDLGPQLQYRMWTLAYIDDRWFHVDALLDNPFAPAERFGLITDALSTPEIATVTTDTAEIIKRMIVKMAGVKYGVPIAQ